MGVRHLFAALLVLSLLSARPARSAEIHGKSSSQLLWYNDFYNGRTTELAEYLQISITKLDKDGNYSIYGYGRGTQDLTSGNGINGRLFYLYLDCRNLFDKVDLKLGRQFVNLSAGTTIIDGGQIDIKNIGPVGFTVFGGRNVVFGINGEISHGGNYALGMAAYLTGFRKTDLDVSWFRKWDQGDVARDIVGASFKQFLFDNIKVYGNARYDLTGEVFNELLGGIKYFPTPNLIFTGEYYQSYPTFDATDIYSVFATNRYMEGVIRGDYTINEIVSVHAGYSRQNYGDHDGDANVYEVGVTLHPVPAVIIGLAYDRHDGYGGNLDGGTFDITWDVNKQLQVAGGLTVDAYDRTFFPSSSGNQKAQKYWLGGKYKLNKNMTASFRIEDDVNVTYNNDVQGRFVFDYTF